MTQLTLKQCVELAKQQNESITPSGLRRAILRDDLIATKHGRDWFVTEQDFLAWLHNKAMHKTGKKTEQDKE